MLDDRIDVVGQENLLESHLELIAALTKERDRLQEKLTAQIQVSQHLEDLLLEESAKSAKQSVRQQEVILYLLEERNTMLQELHRSGSSNELAEGNLTPLQSELAELRLVNSSLMEENHRRKMEAEDLRNRLQEQSRDLAYLSQSNVTVTPRHYRKVPKTNPNIRTPQQSKYALQTPPREEGFDLPRPFVPRPRRSAQSLYYVEEETRPEVAKDKSRNGLLKRLSLRLVSPNVPKE
uniref:CCDC92 domain-containing protein n=1 Tax=Steinernema glaseri TaxID=37863 RepID=A0A1I8AFV5_9BILA